MGSPHLWQGERIDDADLEKRLPMLEQTASQALARGMDIRLLVRALDTLSHELQPDTDLYHTLHNMVAESGTIPPAETEATLRSIAAFISRDAIEDKLLRELGSLDPFRPSRISFYDPYFESWAPLGLLVHVTPTNVFSVGALSLVEGLLSGNVNVIKTGSSDTLFPQTFGQALIDCDASGTLKDFIYIGRISSGRKDLMKLLFDGADGIAAWGGEEAVAGVKAMGPASARIIEWGHKISFVYVAKERIQDSEILEPIARECCLIEQQACSSPQCVCVETDSRDELVGFAERLARELNRVSKRFPRVEPDLQEQAEITTVTELAGLDACLDNARVFEADDGSWRVLTEFSSGLRPSPLFRTIWVKPLLRDKIVESLRPLRYYLQTVGLACNMQSMSELHHLMVIAGATRLRPVGHMTLEDYMGEPHDGVYALQRYARRITCVPEDSARIVSNFAEISAPLTGIPSRAPVMTKKDFQAIQVDRKYAHLFFNSGGSTGEPKLSIFSYRDYHDQMRVAAEGLYAAGLDPTTDRCMNLFVSGRLYGSFVSFFTILEFLEAPQLDVCQHTNFDEIVDTIIQQDVNVLIGLPSFLIQLFKNGRKALAKYRGVKKIFYGGEHMTEPQRKFLRSEFGVELIKAATYGSNDIGPMGYQCAYCDGSVFHLHTRLQELEILDPEEDRPVEESKTGRLVFTPLCRHGQAIARYEIGDLGRWVSGACPCGRTEPRFELQGRCGDVFRPGSTAFLNYWNFVNILAERKKYTGELQLEYGFKTGEKASLVLYVNEAARLDTEDVRSLILKLYREVREFVVDIPVIDFQVKCIPTEQFIVTPRSGKIRHLINRMNA